MTPELLVLKTDPRAALPRYATPGAAGMDLSARLDAPVVIPPQERVQIPTGIAVAIPPGYEGQVRPRSGLALKHGISIPNAPGTIDSDYRGELRVLIINLGAEPVTIHDGDRIAQLVIAPVCPVQIVEAATLPETARGAGGFGSTGAGAYA